jgi:hypothetical protein
MQRNAVQLCTVVSQLLAFSAMDFAFSKCNER